MGLKRISSDFISRVIQINSGEEADEATSERTATVASACRGGGHVIDDPGSKQDQRYARRIDKQNCIPKN